MLYRKFLIFYDDNKLWFWIGCAAIVLLGLSVIGLMSMDSFFAKQQIAMMPLSLLQGLVWMIGSAYFIVKIVYGGGLFSGNKNIQMKPQDIQVTFKDVI